MDITNSADLGAIVRRQRKIHGLSQTELAQLLGTTRQWLSRFEQGSNDVSLGNAFAALDVLGIKLSFAEPQVVSPESPEEPEDLNPDLELGLELDLGDPNSIANDAAQGSFEMVSQTLEFDVPELAMSESSSAVSPAAPAKPVSRFDKLRERDSLAGLSSRLKKANSPATAHVDESSEEFEPTPVRIGKPAHYSIDDDIARIAKSTLFKR